MKVHVDLSMENPTQLCKSIVEDIVDNILNKKTSKADSIISCEKPKVNGDHSDELNLSSLEGDNIDDKELEKILVYDSYEYKKHTQIRARCTIGATANKS